MLIQPLKLKAIAGNSQGAEITDVALNGIAALARLHPGDVINAWMASL